jgi:hypothetical protein
MSRKTFKIGTIFSFKDFPDDTSDILALIVSKQESIDGRHYYYLFHFMDDSQEFRISDKQLSSDVKRGFWKVEYEPGEI